MSGTVAASGDGRPEWRVHDRVDGDFFILSAGSKIRGGLRVRVRGKD